MHPIRHISLPESIEKPMMENIDLYMLKLQSLMSNSPPEHQKLIEGGQGDHEAIAEQFGKWHHTSYCHEEQQHTLVYTQPHI